MDALRIVPADLDDTRIVALLAVHHATATAAVPVCSAHALNVDGLRGADLSVWAGWDGDDLLALGALRALDAGHGEVKSMHTAEVHRGRGAGGAMLAKIIAVARGRGMTRLSLETGATDYFEPARALYRRFGFAECPPFGDYVPDRNSVFMTRAL